MSWKSVQIALLQFISRELPPVRTVPASEKADELSCALAFLIISLFQPPFNEDWEDNGVVLGVCVAFHDPFVGKDASLLGLI